MSLHQRAPETYNKENPKTQLSFNLKKIISLEEVPVKKTILGENTQTIEKKSIDES